MPSLHLITPQLRRNEKSCKELLMNSFVSGGAEVLVKKKIMRWKYSKRVQETLDSKQLAQAAGDKPSQFV